MADAVNPGQLVRDAFLMGLAYGTVSFAVLEAVTFGYPTGAVFWPGAGLTLGVLLRRPRRTWPALLAGVFVAEVVVDLTIPVSLGAALVWAVANTVEPIVGALVLRRRLSETGLTSVPGLLRFLAFGVALGPLVGATVGATAAWATGIDDLWPTWPRWWVGDAIGALMIAPAIIVSRPRRETTGIRPAERGWIILAVAAVVGVSLTPWPGDVWQQGLPYLIAPALVVVAMRMGPRAVTVGLAFTGLTVNAVTAAGIGPFAEYGVYGGLVVAQVCLAAAAFAGLIVMALRYDLVSLRELGEQRAAMANVLAHEIKNPLFAISGNAELLDANAPSELILAARGAIQRGARRIGTTIEDMLALAQFDSPDAPRALEEVDLADLVHEVVELNKAAAELDGVRLAVVAHDLPAVVRGVRDELDKMVLNLISNAIKYTPSGGSVTISCFRDEGQAILICKDEGIGMHRRTGSDSSMSSSARRTPLPGLGRARVWACP